MITTRVGRRGQITLPKPIRRQFGLREGDRIALVPQSGQVVIRPLTQTLLDLRGSVSVSGPQDFAGIRRQVSAARAQKVAQDEC